MKKYYRVNVLVMTKNYNWKRIALKCYSFEDMKATFELKAKLLNRLLNQNKILDYQVEM